MPKDLSRKIFGGNNYSLNISDTCVVNICYDIISYSFIVQSKLTEIVDSEYNNVLTTVDKIKQLIKNISNITITNTSTIFKTDAGHRNDVVDNFPQLAINETSDKIIAIISYDCQFDSAISDIRHYIDMQNSIVNLTSDFVRVSTNSINYCFSEKNKKKAELIAINSAIAYSKNKIDRVILSVAGTTGNYKIKSMSESTSQSDQNNSVPNLKRSTISATVSIEATIDD